MSKFRACLALISALSLSLSACQTSLPGTAGTEDTTGGKNTAAAGQGANTPAGSQPVTTGDFGFSPQVNGFSFENGSGGEFNPQDPSSSFLTVASMQKMFGDRQVCTGNTAGESCKPTPAAKQWQQQINTGMNGGQCEGMAVLALTLFKGLDQPDALEAGKTNAFELTYNPAVREKIGLYFAYQYTEQVKAATVKGTPVEVLEQLRKYLGSDVKDPVTLGFYGEQGGHATTPYKIVDKGNGISHILMYDNNWPGQERFIEVDTNANTWVYNFAATNPAEPADAWKGDAESQTLEFTPLSARLAAASCPYCASTEPQAEDTQQVWLNAGRSGKARIKIVDPADPSRFIGWDAASGRYVNKLTGASFIYDKSIVKQGDAPVAPAIQIPAGKGYKIMLDGKDLTQAEGVSVSVFGKGKAVKVSNIDLDPDQEDTLDLSDDGEGIKYTPGSSPDKESPVFSYAFDNPNGQDYEFEVEDLDAENGEALGVDLEGGKLKVSDSGSGADKYDLKVSRFNEDGTEADFSKDDIDLGEDDTDNINFEDWEGEDAGMLIGPDGEESLEPDVDEDFED